MYERMTTLSQVLFELPTLVFSLKVYCILRQILERFIASMSFEIFGNI